MKLSEQRISHLSHQIRDRLKKEGLAEFRDESLALNTLKETAARHLSVDDEVDSLVRQKLDRQHKTPGSHEWHILYDKYFREEMAKRGW